MMMLQYSMMLKRHIMSGPLKMIVNMEKILRMHRKLVEPPSTVREVFHNVDTCP